MKVVLSSHLKEDKRVSADVAPSLKKRIFKDKKYEVYLYIYPGLPGEINFENDVITTAVSYLQEDLVVITKLISQNVIGDPNDLFKKLVADFEAKGKSPYELVRDAKAWCNLPYTKEDVEALSEAGLLQVEAD